jgi:hypothetical protein
MGRHLQETGYHAREVDIPAVELIGIIEADVCMGATMDYCIGCHVADLICRIVFVVDRVHALEHARGSVDTAQVQIFVENVLFGVVQAATRAVALDTILNAAVFR